MILFSSLIRMSILKVANDYLKISRDHESTNAPNEHAYEQE